MKSGKEIRIIINNIKICGVMMFKEEYSPYKIIHHLDKLIQLKNREQPVPIQIQLVPTNICNQNCIFCAYRMKDSLSNQEFNKKDILHFQGNAF